MPPQANREALYSKFIRFILCLHKYTAAAIMSVGPGVVEQVKKKSFFYSKNNNIILYIIPIYLPIIFIVIIN